MGQVAFMKLRFDNLSYSNVGEDSRAEMTQWPSSGDC